jgi:hypothetical protein
MSTNEQLLQQIDDLVASKTFGLDALEGIKKIKDSLKATLEERYALQKRYDGLCETSTRQGEEIRHQSGVIVDLEKQLADAKALNEAGQKAIYDADKHKAVAEAWQGAMAMVFKPNAVRETVQRNVMRPVDGHPGGNGSYPTPGYLASGTESESVTREDA